MRILSLYSLLGVCALVSCQESFDQRLVRETAHFTQTECPMQVEPGCTLDSIVYEPSARTYTWWYQLSDAGALAFRQNDKLIHGMLASRLRNDVELQTLKEHRVTFCYKYLSTSDGTLVYQTVIPHTEYAVQ